MRRILATLAVVLLVLTGCGDDGDSADQAPPVSLPGQVNNHGTAKAENNMEVEADDVYFGPTFIEAEAGQRFSVELHNEGQSRHTFTSSPLGVDVELAPGDRRTLSLTAPATGLADFHCRFHEGQGMKGAVFIG
jgi:plastocyanin